MGLTWKIDCGGPEIKQRSIGAVGRCDIVQFINARRIEWLGYMDDGMMQKKVLFNQIFGLRRTARLRRRRVQDVERYSVLGVRKGKVNALHGKNGETLSARPMPTQDCSAEELGVFTIPE